jgi:hypothetical protein
MDAKQRHQFLESLQVGDEIAYLAGGLHSNWIITKITRISPTRRFSLSNGSTVNSDGSIRGNNHFYIHPVTEKIRQSIWRTRTIRKLRADLKIDNLSDEQLRVLLEMV